MAKVMETIGLRRADGATGRPMIRVTPASTPKRTRVLMYVWAFVVAVALAIALAAIL